MPVHFCLLPVEVPGETSEVRLGGERVKGEKKNFLNSDCSGTDKAKI